MDATRQTTETNEGHRNLENALEDVLREKEAFAGYAHEARAAKDLRLAAFFEEVKAMYVDVATRIQAMLDEGDAGSRLSSVRSSPTPLQGDPADLSSGQDVAEKEY
jgi:hypothetical protein